MIRTIHRWAAAAAAAAAGLAVATASLAPAAAGAANAPGVAVQSGGVSVDEFAELNRRASDYQLKLILAAKHSGAYLADVDIVVRALPARTVVLEHRSQGPLVLAQLPPGRYEVTATYGPVRPGTPTSHTRIVTVPPSRSLAQMVMYFDTGDEVSPNSPAEFSTR
jgi:hypothetical protein